MLSYTFQMLSQQFGKSFIFFESCCAFLFKVYIRPNRIQDTVPTSKMELFVKIGIYKLIFCRLLYTQHCPVSFLCVSPLLFPFRSRCFQQQISEMVLFVTIAIAASNYMFKVNNRNTRTRCKICSKLTIKIPERCHWRRFGIFIVNFERISHLVLVFLQLTLSR